MQHPSTRITRYRAPVSARPGHLCGGRKPQSRHDRVVRAAQEPVANDVPVVNLEELDGRSPDVFYAALDERGPDTLNAIICYTAKCLPCKAAKPLMKEWEEVLAAQGKSVRFWQFGLTLPNKDVALSLEINSSPRFLCIRNGEVLCHMRGKAAMDDFKEFVFSNC